MTGEFRSLRTDLASGSDRFSALCFGRVDRGLQLSRMKLSELKLLCVCGFYLGANFAAFWLPVLLYGAYIGDVVCLALVVVVLVDYAWPLKSRRG